MPDVLQAAVEQRLTHLGHVGERVQRVDLPHAKQLRRVVPADTARAVRRPLCLALVGLALGGLALCSVALPTEQKNGEANSGKRGEGKREREPQSKGLCSTGLQKLQPTKRGHVPSARIASKRPPALPRRTPRRQVSCAIGHRCRARQPRGQEHVRLRGMLQRHGSQRRDAERPADR